MAIYLRDGIVFRPTSEAALDIHRSLPVSNYIIKQDVFKNFYLEMVDDFPRPSKIYGNLDKRATRFIDTFLDRDLSTGVLLTGEKGSGKTLLGKLVSVLAADRGIPTIIVNQAFEGDGFNKLIQSISEPCIIFFDEFEKTFDYSHQEQILTLLDGVFPSKKLFIMTCNDKYRIDRHMVNRPGRLFYMLEFKGLGAEFVEEYCQDNLKNKSHISTIAKLASMFEQFNFDMLKAMIEEMNRYDESPVEVLEFLNVKIQSDNGEFETSLRIGSIQIPEDDLAERIFRSNPIGTQTFSIGYYAENLPVTAKNKLVQGNSADLDEPVCGNSDERFAVFTANDLVEVDAQAGKFTYRNAANEQVIFTRKERFHFSYSHLLA